MKKHFCVLPLRHRTSAAYLLGVRAYCQIQFIVGVGPRQPEFYSWVLPFVRTVCKHFLENGETIELSTPVKVSAKGHRLYAWMGILKTHTMVTCHLWVTMSNNVLCLSFLPHPTEPHHWTLATSYPASTLSLVHFQPPSPASLQPRVSPALPSSLPSPSHSSSLQSPLDISSKQQCTLVISPSVLVVR